jgi:hypothetical protein
VGNSRSEIDKESLRLSATSHANHDPERWHERWHEGWRKGPPPDQAISTAPNRRHSMHD